MLHRASRRRWVDSIWVYLWSWSLDVPHTVISIIINLLYSATSIASHRSFGRSVMSCPPPLPPNIHNKTPFSDPISSLRAEFLSSRASFLIQTQIKGISLLGRVISFGQLRVFIVNYFVELLGQKLIHTTETEQPARTTKMRFQLERTDDKL